MHGEVHSSYLFGRICLYVQCPCSEEHVYFLFKRDVYVLCSPVFILCSPVFLEFILASMLPFSSQSSCISDVLVQGIELGIVRRPLHSIYLRSNFVTGVLKFSVCSQLLVKGISLTLGNDLAGSKVTNLQLHIF